MQKWRAFLGRSRRLPPCCPEGTCTSTRPGAAPATAGVVQNPRRGSADPRPVQPCRSRPQIRCSGVKRTPGQLHPVSPPRLTPTHVGPGGASLRTRRAGAGSDRQASTAAWAGGYLPVSFVVHGNEIHEKHVVSHGVHAEYLHLEGGEHAPGTEGERRVELGSRGEPRRAIAGTAPSPAQGCSGPAVGAPEPWRPFPFNCPGVLPLTVSGPLAGATGQSGRKRQMRQRSVRARAAVFPGPQQRPEGQARQHGAALPLPPTLGPFASNTRKAPARWDAGLGRNKRHHLPLCHGEAQVKTISPPRFPQPSS